ncbi:hypothetical protein [Undibacterium crateris]|uniref:hypothetical protein n=1 Tax=Undibacterium crateris TaxID=2528175 RepID=UPI001389B4B7|nr:hypothetical protein [Undibacterium crateris]NDI86932.1 hypothetical protein [Undibacterium crateris]
MLSYETGLAIAFLLYLTSIVNRVIVLNSLFEKNLNKIGMRQSRLSLSLKELNSDFKKQTVYAKTFFWSVFLIFGLLSTLLSWLYVLCYVGAFVYERMKDSGAPSEVKEYRWKLRNVNMSFDQIVSEIVKVNGEGSASFDDVKSDLLRGMSERGLNS